MNKQNDTVVNWLLEQSVTLYSMYWQDFRSNKKKVLHFGENRNRGAAQCRLKRAYEKRGIALHSG